MCALDITFYYINIVNEASPNILPACSDLFFAEAWVEKPSFGKSLEEHLNISGREIAFPIEACVTMLLECGMQEEVEGTHTRTCTLTLRYLLKCSLRSEQLF